MKSLRRDLDKLEEKISKTEKSLLEFEETIRKEGSSIVYNLAIKDDPGPIAVNNNKIELSKPIPSIVKLENCHNCGGTVDDTGHCKYCGSLVYLFEGQTFNKRRIYTDGYIE